MHCSKNRQSMSQVGQKAKGSIRANVVRSSPDRRHGSVQVNMGAKGCRKVGLGQPETVLCHEARRHAGRRHRDADHDMIGSLPAPRKLRHETARRLARPTNRPRLRISVRGAARKLHGCSRAVQQRTEPSDAALHGRQSLGRALQGGQDARQVNLLSAQRSGCS